ncbi:MAG: SpoVR family protein [Methylocystaceae bacterium]
MSNYSLAELEYWDRRIVELVQAEGLDCYPQEFDLVSFEQMIGYEAYTGMPSRYPHWSFGKAWERINTYYGYALSGLPYEMVINSNPCLAYLMKDNTLALQILTMAHVYGHNDFFKNNRLFTALTRAETTMEMFKGHADRVRAYTGDPAIGYEQVEKVLDAAHSLRLQSDRHLGIKKLSLNEQKERLRQAAHPPESPYPELVPREKWVEPDLNRVPLEPEYDLLNFIQTYGELEEWERDLITIVHEETSYFLPQIETKIMNEGWASYWHYRLLNRLQLEPELQVEFFMRHNMVIRPVVGSLNPYHMGFVIFKYLEEKEGTEFIKSIRQTERDASFIRRFLTIEMARELDLFEYMRRGKNLVVTEVADEEGFKKIRETLASKTGLGMVPQIKVAEVTRERSLVLEHDFDGREIELEYAQKTVENLARLWKRKVILKTIVNRQALILKSDP